MLLPKPQLSGSFVAPSMQEPVSDSAGSAQFVKSALIWESALLPGLVHNALLAMMIASLSACSAYTVALVGSMFAIAKGTLHRYPHRPGEMQRWTIHRVFASFVL